MSKPPTTDDLRALLEKATDLPWFHEVGYATIHQGDEDSDYAATGGWCGLVECGNPRRYHGGGSQTFMPPSQRDANAAFITAAVNALPALLDRIDELEGEVERFKRMDALGITEHDIAASHPDYEGPDPGDAGDAARKAEIARLGLEVTMWIKRGNEAIEINKSRDREIGGNRTIIARLTRERDEALHHEHRVEELAWKLLETSNRAEAAEERVRVASDLLIAQHAACAENDGCDGCQDAVNVLTALAPAKEENSL